MHHALSEENALFENFKRIGLEIQKRAAALGIQVRTVLNENRPFFNLLSPADQKAVLERLKIYQDIFQMALEEKEDLNEEKKLLWYALQRLKLLPPSNLMNLISENDLVEVYVGHRQVYRTFNYYNMCSYSFDELESVSWDQLFYREPRMTQQILDEVGACLATKKIVTSQIPVHVVQEVSSALKSKFYYQLKYVSPLKDLENGQDDCFLVVISAQFA